PDDRAFHLRVSLWPDALRPGPHREHAYILEPKGRGGGEEPHMKGVNALFLGIFGTFAFSWTGLTLIPNFQIGHLDPQSDEEQTDIYPVPNAANSPAAAASATPPASASPAASASASAAPANSPAPSQSPAANAPTTADTTTNSNGMPPQYSAAWHHLHLYSPRSVLAGSTS